MFVHLSKAILLEGQAVALGILQQYFRVLCWYFVGTSMVLYQYFDGTFTGTFVYIFDAYGMCSPNSLMVYILGHDISSKHS